jgi:periplasmic divalent cation tolerance protein
MPGSELEVRVVLVTAPDEKTAADLARCLVGERLAACVNVVPGVRSIYRWQGAVEEAAEILLVIKTRADRCPALRSRVRELHPYDVPEVLELPASGGSPAYLDWVRAESAEEPAR